MIQHQQRKTKGVDTYKGEITLLYLRGEKEYKTKEENKMETRTKKESKFGRMPSKVWVITKIIANQDEDLNVNKLVMLDEKGIKITWTPTLFKSDDTGLIPSETKVQKEIKQVDLPQIFHNIASNIKNNGFAKIETEYSTTQGDNGQIYFFLSVDDVKEMKLIK